MSKTGLRRQLGLELDYEGYFVMVAAAAERLV